MKKQKLDGRTCQVIRFILSVLFIISFTVLMIFSKRKTEHYEVSGYWIIFGICLTICIINLIGGVVTFFLEQEEKKEDIAEL